MNEIMTQLALAEMEKAILRSYEHPRELMENLKLLDLSEEMLPNKFDFPFLQHTCRETVMRNWIDVQISEKDVHSWFRKNIRNVLSDDYKIAERKNDRRHVPDVWIKWRSEFIPVEIKLHDFDPRHLQQLIRYMDFYKCFKGIAVGRKLNCVLPDNVKFIQFNQKEVMDSVKR